MKVIDVHVTQEDITEGLPGIADYCPIARVLRRSLGVPNDSACSIAVTGPGVYVLDRTGEKIAHLRLPDKAWEFVYRFDGHHKVVPISFRLRATGRFLRAVGAAS